MNIEAYFEDIDREIIKLLRSSRKSVRICVAWISKQVYAPVLQGLALRRVKVEVVFNNDPTNTNHGLLTTNLYATYAIDTRLATAFMHNKFCVIDDEIVITGSFNWSRKAKDSFENIVVIKQDYKLVKKFLHEFYDLVSYYQAFSSNYVEKCHCRSSSYNLAIMGSESGIYEESKIDVWTLCVKNQHVSHVGEEYEQYLQTQLGMKDTPIWDDGYYDKESMLNEFYQERDQLASLQQYFNQRNGNKIHAVGVVAMANLNGHLEWNEEPEYIVNIIWRDMYFRKIIPDALYDDGDDGINKIITEHV
ncbi:phospholipase D-like domain-containing protein [Marinomonas sp. 2405UD66-6]|uniref:phospholipase D-like domain-containing protein n=1 Tax=Marinomonas sp. 2405UD66-6 TaxID=3391834 RepID=UPI0039C96D0C